MNTIQHNKKHKLKIILQHKTIKYKKIVLRKMKPATKKMIQIQNKPKKIKARQNLLLKNMKMDMLYLKKKFMMEELMVEEIQKH